MRKLSEFVIAAATCLLPLEAIGVDPEDSNEVAAHSSPWPMQIAAENRTLVIHSPQFERWEQDRLHGQAAVSVQTEGAEQPNFGVIRFTAHAETDAAKQVVTIRELAIGSADFPAAGDLEPEYLALLQQQLGGFSWKIALQRLRSDLAIDRAMRQARRQPLRNDPPRIIFTDRPAILVPVDGTPVLRALPDTGLMRVVNSRALILFDKASRRYYLHVAGRWMASDAFNGAWSIAENVSAQLERAKELVMQKDQVDLLDDDGEDSRFAGAAPAVYVSTTPTELLQTDGAPEYSPIEHTRLLYVTNSPNTIFLDLVTQQYYALISGRWLRAPRLEEESWTYVTGAELPADFAEIAPDHPQASVLAAVPGTEQAQEAVIANSVPQVASVRRSAARLEITYDGEPAFRPIAGTALTYAANAPIPVISVTESEFYAMDNGVWFVASSPFGPWSVASYVAPVIYSIPRSSPLHYVTYVRVYDETPETVYVGYTPGYTGSYVAADTVVVYGTGWAYRPWIGNVWYGAPVTWGHGFTVIYSWWNPWWPWWSAGWAHYPCFRPWWGPWIVPAFHTRTVVVGAPLRVVQKVTVNNVTVTNVYKRWGPRVVAWDGSRVHHPHPMARFRGNIEPGTGVIADSEGRVRRIGGKDASRHLRGHDRRAHDRNSLPPLQLARPRAQWDSQAPPNFPNAMKQRSQPTTTQRWRDGRAEDRQRGPRWHGIERRAEPDQAQPIGKNHSQNRKFKRSQVVPEQRAQPQDGPTAPQWRDSDRRVERSPAQPPGKNSPQRREFAQPPHEQAPRHPIARQRNFTAPARPEASTHAPHANAAPRARPERKSMTGPGPLITAPQARSSNGRRGEGAGRDKIRMPIGDRQR